MESSVTGICFLIYAVFALTASAAITSLSPDQLAQIISKNPTKNVDTNLFDLKPDENDQYVDDTLSLSKRNADLNSISVVDIFKGAMKYQYKPSKKTIRSTKLKSNKARDLVLEIVRTMIEKEKARRKFDLVNPPNSKYTKNQQLLWDRLRVKAAEEVLVHQKPPVQRVTERIFNNLKMDLEQQEPEVTLGPELFPDFKKRLEKQFLLGKSEIGRVYISTLKPAYFE